MKLLQTRCHAVAVAVAALSLVTGATPSVAAELGRQDVAAPAAMISVCGGVATGNGVAIGDVMSWVEGNRHSCNAAQTASAGATVAQAATYLEAPVLVNTDAHGQTAMGQTKLFAHSIARNDAGIAQASANGGWVDVLTLVPLDPANNGATATLTFVIDVSGTLSGQGANFSFNSSAGFGVKPYLNDFGLPVVGNPGASQQFVVSGQGQNFAPYNQTVDQGVSFTASIVLGTPFELGIFARATAGNASSTGGSAPFAVSEATTDFASTIEWAGISGLTVGGNPVPFSVSSASGIDWAQPYAPVPEPAAGLLWAAGLLAIGAVRGRKLRRAR